MSNTKEQTEVLVKSLTGDDVADLIEKAMINSLKYKEEGFKGWNIDQNILLTQLTLLQKMLRTK